MSTTPCGHAGAEHAEAGRRAWSVTDVRFAAALGGDQRQGLLGFLSCVIAGQLRLDGLTLRRTRHGRLALTFPVRRDTAGRQHPIVRPVNDASRRAFEAAVFAALGLDGAQAGKGPP